MSVIAWDGKTLAADRMAVNNGLNLVAQKLFIVHQHDLIALAFTHGMEEGHMLMQWYLHGAKKEEWPSFQDDENRWARLVILKQDGLYTIEQCPIEIQQSHAPLAWGMGRDFALGAMMQGADATRAVEIANELSIYCGFGVDTVNLSF